MQTGDGQKKHHNLYYIFKEDQREHPMPQHEFRNMQQKLAEILGKRDSDIGCETS